MAIELSDFDTVALTGIITLRPPKWGLFASFFSPQAPSATDIFELHTQVRGETALPVVSDFAPGVTMQSTGWELGQVKAPRFRTKRSFRVAEVLNKRQIGRTPYDLEADPLSRLVAEDMDQHRADHDHMIEIMCAQAAITGEVTLYNVDGGTAVPTISVDYQRPNSHTITVADKWDVDATDLYGQLETANRLIQEDADGMTGTDLIMGATAFAAFRRHPDVVDIMDNKRMDGGGALSLSIGQLMKGTWDGLNIWVYSDTYKDIDGTVKHYIAPNDAVLLSRSAQSVIEYGRPLDLDCAGPAQYFAKQFSQPDPSGIFTVAESRPLPVTRHAAWSVHFVGCATVQS